jgi:hypothetical protein
VGGDLRLGDEHEGGVCEGCDDDAREVQHELVQEGTAAWEM